MMLRLLLFLAAASSFALVAPRLLLWSGKGARVSKPRSAGGPNLLRIGRTPAITVDSSATVMETVKTMEKEGVGAVLVVDDDELMGIFTERDVMLRVTLPKKAPETTPVRDVMTSPVTTIENTVTPDEALKMMQARHIRHFPILGKSRRVEGMLSIRHLLGAEAERLEVELDSLAAYVSADGIGG